MVFLTACCTLAYLSVPFWGYVKFRRWERRDAARRDVEDLRARMVEMCHEDELSPEEWRNWKPICLFADEQYRQANGSRLPWEQTSEYLLQIILRGARRDSGMISL